MSAIPPNVVVSALQAEFAQRTQTQQTQADQNARVETARIVRGTGKGEDIIEVEATDADTQVHPDTGGMGGQGRHDATGEQDEETTPKEEGFSVDDDGRLHIDLSA